MDFLNAQSDYRVVQLAYLQLVWVLSVCCEPIEPCGWTQRHPMTTELPEGSESSRRTLLFPVPDRPWIRKNGHGAERS